MIVIDFLDLRDGEAERNPKSVKELEIEKLKLFNESNPRLVSVRKNLPNDFKLELIKPFRKYHKFFT